MPYRPMETGISQSRAGFSMVPPGPLKPNSSAKIAYRACYLITCLTLIGSGDQNPKLLKNRHIITNKATFYSLQCMNNKIVPLE